MKTRKIIITLCIIHVFYLTVHAQSAADTTSRDFKPSIFLTLGIGVAFPGLAGTIQLNIEDKRRNTFTVGMNSRGYDDTAVLTTFAQWGKSHKVKNFYNEWGIGPSYSHVSTYESGFFHSNHQNALEEKNGFGIHLTWQFLWTGKGGAVGAGVEPFVDLNTANTHVGLVFIIGIGRINKIVP